MLNFPSWISWLGEIDWVDNALHVAGAFGIMTVLMLLGVNPFVAMVANAIIWFGREMWQGWGRTEGQTINPLTWRVNKWAEAITPSVTGLIMALQVI